MRLDWVPYSAASLVAGAGALAVGAVLLPPGDQSGAELLATLDDDRWLVVAGLFYVAAIALIAGLPSVLVLFETRASRMGLAGGGVFLVGCLGLAGYAMLLVFARALARSGLDPAVLDAAAEDAGLLAFLYAWIAMFYLGEALLAVALLRAGTVPTWLPVLLLVHVALLPLGPVLPPTLQSASTLLVTLSLSGLAIAANQRNLAAAVAASAARP
jgi:hypothetical protein